jgi:hypothetical protein
MKMMKRWLGDIQGLLPFQIPKYSVAYVIPKNPSKAETLCNISQHGNFFTVKGCSTQPNPQVGGPPLIRYS